MAWDVTKRRSAVARKARAPGVKDGPVRIWGVAGVSALLFRDFPQGCLVVAEADVVRGDGLV